MADPCVDELLGEVDLSTPRGVLAGHRDAEPRLLDSGQVTHESEHVIEGHVIEGHQA